MAPIVKGADIVVLNAGEAALLLGTKEKDKSKNVEILQKYYSCMAFLDIITISKHLDTLRM